MSVFCLNRDQLFPVKNMEGVSAVRVFLGALFALLPLPLHAADLPEGYTYPRQVVKMLTVGNGHAWGSWERMQFCPMGTYASGFEIKLDKPHFVSSDDTAVNALSLQCSSPATMEDFGRIESQVGPWGDWEGLKECRKTRDHKFFLSAFQMQVEQNRGSFGDDTSVNNIRFKCRPLREYREHLLSTKGTPWGDWGGWSENCPVGTAICGIQVRMSAPRGNGDDVALNDVRLFCCKDFRLTIACSNAFDYVIHDTWPEDDRRPRMLSGK